MLFCPGAADLVVFEVEKADRLIMALTSRSPDVV